MSHHSSLVVLSSLVVHWTCIFIHSFTLHYYSGTYTINALVYTTSDYNGNSQLLHARAWNSAEAVINAIGGDVSTTKKDQWNTVTATIAMGTYFFSLNRCLGDVFMSTLRFFIHPKHGQVPVCPTTSPSISGTRCR
jgi:hypothetical protein